jgi:hypothetical protein
MKRPTEVVIPVGAHELAVAEARAFASLARSISPNVLSDKSKCGDALAYLANAGLSAELYLKTLMIAGRGGRITTGHDLWCLYNELPEFLTKFMAWQYEQLSPQGGWPIVLTALTFRGHSPTPPESTPVPKLATFSEAIQSNSRIFEHSRYFFERVTNNDWAIFAVSRSSIDAMLVTLDRTYEHFKAGDFNQNP